MYIPLETNDTMMFPSYCSFSLIISFYAVFVVHGLLNLKTLQTQPMEVTYVYATKNKQ